MPAKDGQRAKISKVTLDECVAFWLGNVHVSQKVAAERFGVSQSTLCNEIKARGLKRSAAAAVKRAKVQEHFSGVMPGDPTRPGEVSVDLQALEDIKDMELCLSVARRVVRKLDRWLTDDEELIDSPILSTEEKAKLRLPPREIKVIAETNNVAMETIRKIRGLDAPIDWDSLTDEQLDRLAKGLPL